MKKIKTHSEQILLAVRKRLVELVRLVSFELFFQEEHMLNIL